MEIFLSGVLVLLSFLILNYLEYIENRRLIITAYKLFYLGFKRLLQTIVLLVCFMLQFSSSEDNNFDMNSTQPISYDLEIKFDMTQAGYKSNKERMLLGVPSAKTSKVEITSTIIYANKNASIRVTLNDDYGNLASLGKDQLLFAQISNQSIKNKNFKLIPTYKAGEEVLEKDIFQQMTLTKDGTYKFDFSISKVGKITICVMLYTKGGFFAEYYYNSNYTGDNILNRTLKKSYFGYTSGLGAVMLNSDGDYVTIVFHYLLRSPKTCFLNFNVYANDCTTLVIENTNWPRVCGTNSTGFLSATDGEYYRGYIIFSETTDHSYFKYSWACDTYNHTDIPQTNYFSPEYVGLSPIQATVICELGYNADSVTRECALKCGDGLRIDSEKCDDGNTIDGDGCKGDCTAIESNWVCSGGSMTSRDVCVKCTEGFYQNDVSNPSSCISKCRDERRVGSERCDDGNTIDGDGCKGDCSTVEPDWVCSGGNMTSKDVCTKCTDGFYQNDVSNPATCISKCGDGRKVGSEKCDDGNTIDGDGCKGDCSAIETDYICTGGNSSTKDSCKKCEYGINQAVNPPICISNKAMEANVK